MKIAKTLINSLKNNLLLPEDKIPFALDAVRENDDIRKLTMLVRNSASALNEVINCINDMTSDSINDLKIFSLMVCLHDANRLQEARKLSMNLCKLSEMKHTRTISHNILLKDLLDV